MEIKKKKDFDLYYDYDIEKMLEVGDICDIDGILYILESISLGDIQNNNTKKYIFIYFNGGKKNLLNATALGLTTIDTVQLEPHLKHIYKANEYFLQLVKRK